MADRLTLDRTAMRDKSTSHLRIFVGNINQNTTVEDLYEHFIQYGQINGIVINKGFGFVQFDKESSAQQAILQANGSSFQDRNLVVKTAQTNDKPKETEVVVVEHKVPPAVALKDNGYVVEKPAEPKVDSYPTYGGYDEQDPIEEEDEYGYGIPRGRGLMRQRGRGVGLRGRGTDIPFRERSPLLRGRPEIRPDRGYDRYPAPASRTIPISERNDCEIIVVAKSLTQYAEYIESRLKRLGIVVDLLFPMEDVPIGRVLGNIASRGCLYAILVMPMNQDLGSLTLTILHGIPQEHRNIPLEDALCLLARNFEEVKRGGTTGREAVYALLGQIADGRALTSLQYDKVMDYLKERRAQQHKMETNMTTVLPTDKKKTQDVLQQRILSILNEKKVESPPAKEPEPPKPKAKPQGNIMNDPSVRKALDSILNKFV